MHDRFDLVVIGGGIVGLAAAYQLLLRRPSLSLAVVEKERELASHQTGHNSGVLHAGLFYAAGSRKARLCREGKTAIESFAATRGIPFERCGKLVVALSAEELPRLASIRDRAAANGVPGVEEIGARRMREIEPHVAGIRALWSPESGIIDFRRVALSLADEVRAFGGAIRTETEVSGIEARGNERILHTSMGDFVCRNVVACAGLQSDRVAAMTGSAGSDRIVPFRGDYYTLKPEAQSLVRGLIYPVPDPRFPFLGVHFTRTIGGEVLAGPNAVLAFAREGYGRRDFSPQDLAQTLAFPGFQRLAWRHWKTGLGQLWRDWSRKAYLAELQRYVPAINNTHIVFGPSGVRAQAVAREGTLIDDFLIREAPHVLHLVNAPSPAATACLAIGRELAERAIGSFGLE